MPLCTFEDNENEMHIFHEKPNENIMEKSRENIKTDYITCNHEGDGEKICPPNEATKHGGVLNNHRI